MRNEITLLLKVYSMNAKTQNYCLFDNNKFLTRNIEQLNNVIEMFENDIYFPNYNNKISVYENFKQLDNNYLLGDYGKIVYIKKYVMLVENRIMFLYNKLLKNS